MGALSNCGRLLFRKAKCKQNFRAACAKISEYFHLNLNLKVEQRNAVTSPLERNDILAILPTGFGKSLIFFKSLILRLKENATLIVWPLENVIDD